MCGDGTKQIVCMIVKKFICNPFQENCYVVTEDGETLIIDCGAWDRFEQERIAQYIENEAVASDGSSTKVVGHLLTHGHLDHVFGAAWVQEKWGIMPTIGCKDERMLYGLQEQCDMWGIPAMASVGKAKLCNEGDLMVGHFRIKVIETPGHTAGGVCYMIGDLVFTGDTLFDGGYGRTDLPGGNFEKLMDSLERLSTIIRGKKVYPGHGGAFFSSK